MISRGFTGGGESSLARKAHLRSIRSWETLEVQAVSKLPRLDTTITFSDSDMEGCQHPHDDPLVIMAVVANKTIHRVLVDNGSSPETDGPIAENSREKVELLFLKIPLFLFLSFSLSILLLPKPVGRT